MDGVAGDLCFMLVKSAEQQPSISMGGEAIEDAWMIFFDRVTLRPSTFGEACPQFPTSISMGGGAIKDSDAGPHFFDGAFIGKSKVMAM